MKRRMNEGRNRSSLPWIALVLVAGVIGGLFASRVASSNTMPQATFATPAEAGQALRAAAQNADEAALANILGPDSKAVLSSGDPKEDRAALEEFVFKYDQMNRWVHMTDGSQILNIGADNYPFPIPLVQDSSSNWFFNTKAGADEILARRIGRNELLAIDAISAIADAEVLYAKTCHDGNPAGTYTTKVFSTPGKQDGLFWEAPEDEEPSPLGKVNQFAHDALSTPSDAPVIDGYSFRILTAQGSGAEGGAKNFIDKGKMTGGFAVIATPVKYRDSGIMTFIVGKDGEVFQQDLGEQTTKVAASIREFNPTGEWELVD